MGKYIYVTPTESPIIQTFDFSKVVNPPPYSTTSTGNTGSRRARLPRSDTVASTVGRSFPGSTGTLETEFGSIRYRIDGM